MTPTTPSAGDASSASHRSTGARNAARAERVRAALLSGGTLLVTLASVATLLVGCANPGGIAPTGTLKTAADVGLSANAAATAWPASDWWRAFGDQQLARIVDEALAGQPNLKAVQARVTQAAAASEAAGAARLPQVGASVDLTDQRFTKNGLVPPPLAGSLAWNNSATLNASWELDLFGRHRAELESSLGTLRAAEADQQAARLLLAGNVVSAYVNLARLVETQQLLQAGLAQREQVLTLVRQRIGAGLDTNVDLRQAEALVAQTRVEIEAAAEQVARTRHALAELAGRTPEAYATLVPQLVTVQAHALPATLPADLLGRRADIVAQRWRVEAALRDVAAARTQFYPSVNLVAFAGLSSLGLDKLLQSGSQTYGAGPALRLPIFEGGRLRANLKAKSAEVDAAIEGYNGALLRALREVADEVSTLQSLDRQQAAQADALQAAEAAFGLAVERYRAGLGNFLVVLSAEQNVLAQRRASAELKARRLASEAQLARALGGGYDAKALPEATHPDTTLARAAR